MDKQHSSHSEAVVIVFDDDEETARAHRAMRGQRRTTILLICLNIVAFLTGFGASLAWMRWVLIGGR